MLEYDFNELDNDFVTLWSKKIVSGEDTLIFKDLTKLAELGQINAVQSWYLIAKRTDKNNTIDNLVSNLGNGGANEMLAIAHKDFFKNDRYARMCELYTLGKSWDLTNGEELRVQYLNSMLNESDYIRYLTLSLEAHYNTYTITHNPLILERFYEIASGLTKAHKYVLRIEAHVSGLEFKKHRKTLLEMYSQDKNNVAVAFALGKNLTLFKANSKLKALGSQILTELSKRELSKTLQDYEVKGLERLIKQQIDKNAQEEVEENLSAQDRYVQKVFESVEKTGIKFSGNHRVGALTQEQTLMPLTPEQIGAVDKEQ